MAEHSLRDSPLVEPVMTQFPLSGNHKKKHFGRPDLVQ